MKKSVDEGVDDGDGIKLAIETTSAKKAEWERLTFVEKFVKKFFPSQINSIAILVN